VAWKISFQRVENVGQGSGIIIDIRFPLYGLENKFQCPGIDLFMPETDKFRAFLRLQVVFFAVYIDQATAKGTWQQAYISGSRHIY
jgi:hypothetical protein